MPWQAGAVAIRPAVLTLLAVLAALSTAGCSDDDDSATPPQPTVSPTTDADCAERLPDSVFATLGWTPTAKGAEATQRGCHRDAEQGYVEVRDRGGYDELCASLDRTGGVAPGVPVDWLGDDVTACAVEPAAGVGTTKVVVQRAGGRATQITVAVLTDTPQAQVREAVAELL